MTDHRPTVEIVLESIAAVTLLKSKDIKQDATFESYGMDSVQLMELQSKLADVYSGLSKTVLFEYPSVTTLLAHLTEKFPESVPKVDSAPKADSASAEPTESVKPATVQVETSSSFATGHSRQPVEIGQLFNKVSGFMASSAQQRVEAQTSAPAAVSVIGMDANFPHSPNLQAFWENIVNAEDCMEKIPADRWDADALRHEDQASRLYGQWGGFIESVEAFDHEFFQLSKAEALRMDPQLRLLLQGSWHALEHAGYLPEALASKNVGVFVGAMNNDHSHRVADVFREQGLYAGAGSFDSELANHLSYYFDFHGPSYTVKSACSASTTALHLACQAIRQGECSAALVAGVNLSLHPSKYFMMQDMKVLSADSCECTFDEQADGLLPSDGVGVVVLKRADQAEMDEDQIYANILGSALSHAGRGAGQYMPNLTLMQNTMSRAFQQAGVSADDVSYVESHGTATSLGDPIELKALENGFSQSSRQQPLFVGTKANFGHMESASGMCALIKVVLSMQHQMIAPCANLNRLNDAVSEDNSFLTFARAAVPWKPSERGHLAALNSFGMGGSNAFVVLESAQARAKKEAYADTELVLISAKNTEQLKAHLASLLTVVFEQTDDASINRLSLADIAWTSQIGRTAWPVRCAIVCQSITELMDALTQCLSESSNSGSVYWGQAGDEQPFIELLGSSEGSQYIQALVDNQSLNDLAKLWVSGANIPWSQLKRSAPCQRTPLYRYAFDNTDCALMNGIETLKQLEAVKQEDYEKRWAAKGSMTHSSDVWYTGKLINNAIEPVSDQAATEYWQQRGQTARMTDSLLRLLVEDPTALESLRDQAHESSDLAQPMSVSPNLLASAKSLTNQLSVEVETLCLAAWILVTNRYSRGGFPLTTLTADRLGLASLPYCEGIDARQTVRQWLSHLQQEWSVIKQYQHSDSHNIWQAFGQPEVAELQLTLAQQADTSLSLINQAWLHLSIDSDDERLACHARYDDRLAQPLVELFMENYVGVLQSLVNGADQMLSAVALPKNPLKKQKSLVSVEVQS